MYTVANGTQGVLGFYEWSLLSADTNIFQDGLFANMTYEDWRASTDPKIIGSWNLHTILPKGLDFFILLSSIAGVIGSAGQANYAAGNTYMDALVHYRKALGEQATALDLGVILEQGVLASNHSLRERFLAQGFLAGISNADLFGLLDYYCNANRAIVEPADAQLAIGLTHPSKVRTKVHQGSGPFISLPFYRHIFNGTSDADQEHGSKDPTENARRDFVAAGTMTEAGAVVSRALIQRLIKNTPDCRIGSMLLTLWTNRSSILASTPCRPLSSEVGSLRSLRRTFPSLRFCVMGP